MLAMPFLALAPPRPSASPIGSTSERHIRSLRWSHGQGSALSASDVQVLTGLLPTSSAFSETARLMRTVRGKDARGLARGLIPNATSLVGGCRSELPRRQVGSSPYGKLLNLCDAVGPGVEVGVFEGMFSTSMLAHAKGGWRGLTHYTLVDLWARQNESVYVRDSANVDDDVQEKRYRNTLKWVVEPNAPRVSVLRMLSVQAAAHFADQSLGFVYLDANHGYRALLDDMEAYYPKLMAGGMLAGHDYINLRAFGVIKAVREFTQARGLSFVLTDPPTGRYREPICCSGWYLFKPRAPGEPSTHSPRAAAEWECAALVRVTAM